MRHKNQSEPPFVPAFKLGDLVRVPGGVARIEWSYGRTYKLDREVEGVSPEGKSGEYVSERTLKEWGN